ncbi:MAG: PhoX family phosphatase [Steroidobacteraceae bacterium]|jgi:secreted PhoX family phosphatase|nr:PhoX family phosphatase [Steroidobacteraceae bacterium]
MRDDDRISNPSTQPPFHEVLAVNVARRRVLAGGLAVAVAAFLPAARAGADGPTPSGLLGFHPVRRADARGPMPAISPDYRYETLVSWGDRVRPGSSVRPYDGDPSRRPTAAEQEELVGIGHDGMTFFPKAGAAGREGTLCLNHEYGTNPHVLGKPWPQSLEDVRLSQHAHGVSVLGLREVNGRWQVVDVPHARRIHANTPVEFSGPAAGHALLRTPSGDAPRGTFNNCSNGATPWGTYLTCEENFDGYFGTESPWSPSVEQARYGLDSRGFGYGWHRYDPRFDLADPRYRNAENRYGWVVEIDPLDPARAPVKRTALGRFKHEGAAVTVGDGGRVVVYMGDDQANDYVYKFVSEGDWRAMRAAGRSPLDHGRLYVARFDADGTGAWLELTADDPRLKSRLGDQGAVVTYVRLAADLLGATPMDRPEWTTVAPDGRVYCSLTNNRRRAAPNAANPLAPNPHGHILRWRELDGHVGTRFAWEIFLMAKDSHDADHAFGSPDGLWADPDGRLFVETDGDQPDDINNQLLVADTRTGEVRRLFAGVSGDEVTGIAHTPDRRTLFVNVQHPGDGDPRLTNFPRAFDGTTVPRDSTVVIRRKDGGVVGS